LLVAYELLWDCLDSLNERGAERGQVNGRQLHLALVEALDPDLPISDYCRYHPWSEDGGYLKALVEACRYESVRLSSYESVRPLLVREAWRAQALGINHELDPVVRDRALSRWAKKEWPDLLDAHWWELTGAASASLTIHALLALASRPHADAKEIHHVYRAYSPWISAATTMLDSYVDQAEDALNDDHSYVAHYPSWETALHRVGELVRRSIHEASVLPDAERHILIVAAMVAMYLSKDSARTREMREQTSALIQAGGPLTRLLLPVLRLWRVLYRQRST
jgi:tetraprenyl-beta-curcumene synthase